MFEAPANRGVTVPMLDQATLMSMVKVHTRTRCYISKQVHRSLLFHDFFLEVNVGVTRSFSCEV